MGGNLSFCCLQEDISKEKQMKMNQLESQKLESYLLSENLRDQRELGGKLENWMIFEENQKNESIEKEIFYLLFQEYDFYQEYYSIVWEDVDLKQKNQNKIMQDFSRNEALLQNLKYLLRRGAPLKLCRDLILKMFQLDWDSLEKDYIQTKSIIFKGKEVENMKIVPTFSEQKDLKFLLKINCLSKKGKSALDRIMWLLQDTVVMFDLIYNPLVPQTISILLLFLKEFEVFYIIETMINQSQKILNENSPNQEASRLLRWHFSLTQKQFLQKAKSFVELAEKRDKQFILISKHLDQIGFKLIKLFVNWLENLFFGVLQLQMIIRIVMVFLNEGIRVFFKIAYGILIMSKDQILECSKEEEVESLLKNYGINFDTKQNEELFRISYKLKIKKTPKDFKKIRISSIMVPISQRVLYRPRVNFTNNNILQYKHFEAIWEFIPNIYRLQNPIQIYSSFRDGFSISNLLRITSNYQIHNPILIIIKTEKNVIFGAFCDQMLISNYQNGNYYGTDETFVFTIEPQEIFYTSNNQNQEYILTKNDHFYIGNQKPAIFIQQDFTGYSEYCETFSSLPLHAQDEQHLQLIMKGNSQFSIANMECFILGV